MMALLGLPDIYVVMLTEAVSERGEALWCRFRDWRDAQTEGGSSGFSDWIQVVLRENMMKLLYPKGCTLPQDLQMMFASRILPAINAKTDEDTVAAHFGQEPQYSIVRREVCDGCATRECPHWVGVRQPKHQARQPSSFSLPSTARKPQPAVRQHEQMSRTQLADSCAGALRSAPNRGDAKKEIKRILKRGLSQDEKRMGNSVTITWSSNASARRARIYLNAVREEIVVTCN